MITPEQEQVKKLREEIAKKYFTEHYQPSLQAHSFEPILWKTVGQFIKDECYSFADSILNLLKDFRMPGEPLTDEELAEFANENATVSESIEHVAKAALPPTIGEVLKEIKK